MRKDRKSAVSEAMKLLEKKYGTGSVQRLGDKPERKGGDVFSTGSLRLDKALGVGGFGRGKVIEIFGPESCGKTTLCLHAIAQIHKLGGAALFIDAEHALDTQYAKALGVDIDELIVTQPDYGEQALDIAVVMMETGGFDLVVVDSVAALTPKAELDGEIGDRHVAGQARLMSQALRKIKSLANQNNTTVIFINQLRMKIGVMFGNPETTPGGKALKYYSDVRVDIRKSKSIKKGMEVVGNATKIKIVKNKLAPPFQLAEVDIVYGKGLCPVRELVQVAETLEVIDKRGSHFYYEGEKIAQGFENLMTTLEQDPKLLKTIADHARAEWFGTERDMPKKADVVIPKSTK